MKPDFEKILDLIFAHNKSHIKRFLVDIGQPVSGTNAQLRDRFNDLTERGIVKEKELLGLLNLIEGWGDQHVFLYKAVPRDIRLQWANLEKFKALLAKNNLQKLLNAQRSIVLPEDYEIASIEHDGQNARIVWVAKRTWEERQEEKDKTSNEMLFKAYKTHVQRAVMSFDLDLKTGLGMMMIQKLPNNSNSEYENIKHVLEREIKPLIDLKMLEGMKLKKAITEIQNSKEARARQIEDKTNFGSSLKYTSTNRKTDIEKDPAITSSRKSTQSATQPVMGNFYWDPLRANSNLDSELHTVLYSKDNRIGIYGERTQEEVRYVIQRIRELGQ